MLRILMLCAALSLIAIVLSCGQGPSAGGSGAGGAATPTDAYKQLFAAVKSQDVEAIKKQLTKKSIEFGAMAAQRNNTPIEKMYANGFTATTFSDTLPEMRDERIKDDMASLEVWNAKESKWEDLPFINEEGGWKLAVGDLFAGTFKSPGLGLDAREKQAANSIANTMPTAQTPKGVNAPIKIINAQPAMPMQENKKP